MEKYIKVRGARQHNLNDVNLDIPKGKLVTLTGVSGSGKSSLAFDTIYAEGQRRYVESLSTYARQFLGVMGKPDVDLIEGLSPAISIDQKTVSHNPRSTVGTVTEIYDYLRLLFARVGHPHCPICGREIESQSAEQITGRVLDFIKNVAKTEKKVRLLILSPVVQDKKGEFSSLFENLRAKGYKRVRIDKVVKDLSEDFVLIKTNKHTIEAVADRISLTWKDINNKVGEETMRARIADSIEQALELSNGLVVISEIKDTGFEIPDDPKEMEDHLFSERFACPVDNIELPEIEPRTFSFNAPQGACPKCSGIGKVRKVDPNMVFAPLLSIREGGIIPYASIFEHDTWHARLIVTACEEQGIDTGKPIKDLSKKEVDVILNGTGEKNYKVEGTNRFGKSTFIYEPFYGINYDLEKRYEETDSEYVKSGIERYMTEVICPECEGARLKPEALGITIDQKSINDIVNLPIDKAIEWATSLNEVLSKRELEIGTLILKEVVTRLTFLSNVGLNYLTLGRGASTLAGGEAQRIRLASQIGSGLTGVLYVLDEPTIGLHPRDNDRLIATLHKMRDLENTVVVVEHDKEVMEASDYIFDFGPGAGRLGGNITAKGTPAEIKKDKNSITGKYLSGKKKIYFPKTKNIDATGSLKLKGASLFNLKGIDINFPLGKLIAVTGVSGSGKSTLIVETLYQALKKELSGKSSKKEGYEGIEGIENIDKVVLIDQSPIGRTPRSNPATYTKVFDVIRDVFTATREARAQGYKKGRFSFNVKGGRCESCEGQGQTKIEMQFMPDIWIPCEVCHGARYNSQTLGVTYKGKSIADILKMSVSEALEFFHVYSKVVSKLETLKAVGLDYMELGQPATTLSGGEAQRIKLSSELSRRDTGRTVYILDEPTTGLHFADLERLLAVLKILVERGNTVIVIEHNLDVVKNADWVIDLGPEGGDGGGRVVAEGTPEDIIKSDTYTAKYLKHEMRGK